MFDEQMGVGDAIWRGVMAAYAQGRTMDQRGTVGCIMESLKDAGWHMVAVDYEEGSIDTSTNKIYPGKTFRFSWILGTSGLQSWASADLPDFMKEDRTYHTEQLKKRALWQLGEKLMEHFFTEEERGVAHRPE